MVTLSDYFSINELSNLFRFILWLKRRLLKTTKTQTHFDIQKPNLFTVLITFIILVSNHLILTKRHLCLKAPFIWIYKGKSMVSIKCHATLQIITDKITSKFCFIFLICLFSMILTHIHEKVVTIAEKSVSVQATVQLQFLVKLSCSFMISLKQTYSVSVGQIFE